MPPRGSVGRFDENVLRGEIAGFYIPHAAQPCLINRPQGWESTYASQNLQISNTNTKMSPLRSLFQRCIPRHRKTKDQTPQKEKEKETSPLSPIAATQPHHPNLFGTYANLPDLPVELFTLISAHLSTADLKRLRAVCRATSEAVFDAISTLIPSHLVVHGKRRESLMDLAYLGETFQMKDRVTRLSIFHLRPEFGRLLAGVRLPCLVSLRVARGVLRGEEGLVALLGNCRGSLREVGVEDVCFVVEGREMREGRTQGWRRVVRVLDGEGFGRVVRVGFERVGYCDQEGREERWVVPKVFGRRGMSADWGGEFLACAKSLLFWWWWW